MSPLPAGDPARSRKGVREEIGTGLTTALAALAQDVYDHQARVIGTASPVVRVYSVGSFRPQRTGRGLRSVFRFVIQVWVLYGDEETETYTEEEAEDLLDDIEKGVIDWMDDNQNNQIWTGIQYLAPGSEVRNVRIGSEVYLVEDIPIEVQVYG